LGAARGWRYPLLLHPVGLGAQDEAEEVLIGDCGAPGRRGRARASLVVQPGTLETHNGSTLYIHRYTYIRVLTLAIDLET